MSMKWISGVLVTVAIACTGGDEPVDYLAMQPTEAARELAEGICSHYFSCGILSRSCDSDNKCRYFYVPAASEYGTQAACVADEMEDIGELLLGCAIANLEPVQKSALNSCFNAPLKCFSQAELADLSLGRGEASTFGVECEIAEDVLETCDLCEEAPNDPQCN